MKVYIYSLSDPLTKQIRYIGKTINLKVRFYNHIDKAIKLAHKRHVYSWIRSVLKQNLLPIMEIIEECEDNWAEREIYWIAHHKAIDTNLCNHSIGGEGNHGSRLFQNEDEIVEIVSKRLKEGLSQQDIEKELHVHAGYIANLRRRHPEVIPKSIKPKVFKVPINSWKKGITCVGMRKNKGKGYYFSKVDNKWIVKVTEDFKVKRIGHFKTEQEAIDCVANYRNSLCYSLG